jgi:hypothetical protein
MIAISSQKRTAEPLSISAPAFNEAIMRIPALLGLAAQASFKIPQQQIRTMADANQFQFKEDSNVFSPKDLVELGRPGTAVANLAGDLMLVPFSKYSLQDKKCVLDVL